MQSRTHSLIEAATNTASGFAVSWLASLVVYPFFGARFDLQQITAITVIFTGISVARNYIWRRLFNRLGKTGLSRPASVVDLSRKRVICGVHSSGVGTRRLQQ